MKDQLTRAEYKLSMIMKHAPMGIAEIDGRGEIVHLNLRAEAQLNPLLSAFGISENNLLPLLRQIVPSVAEKIGNAPDDAGYIITNELHSFFLPFAGGNIERHFNFTVIRMCADSIVVCLDEPAPTGQKDCTLQQLASDKALLQGKFEIASNILHDIGNAVVGFGSYVSRIRRSLDQGNSENLQKLTLFFTEQQATLAPVFGEARAVALVSMLKNITEEQKNKQVEIRKSVAEQQNIINHIQDILNIQRQYVTGNEALEKRPTNLRGIITDCMSMLYASIEKRGIRIFIHVPDVLPVIKADRTRLMQVILNILKNSIEAIDITAAQKNISLTVNVHDSTLVMEIEDTGQGFDEATGKQLFERGYTTKPSGSGIGLDNCRAIIASHDGTIDITSKGLGQGALAIIRFNI